MRVGKAKNSVSSGDLCQRGNHGTVFFGLSVKIIACREDVIRHSALDKLLGCLSDKTTDGFSD
jgi:formate dehydrogenase assembly factor FdhD